MRKFLSMALLLVMVLGLAPLAVAEEGVTITIGKEFDPTGKVFPEGQDVENNYYLDYVKEKTGVSIEYTWILADDEQKIALALASGTMPDVMLVDLATFNMLIESDMIQPLTEAFEAEATPYMLNGRENYAESYDAATVNGELMAIPNTVVKKQHLLMWIRQDWLDNLGLEAPTTLEELETVARAFIEQDPDGNGEDDTIGLPLNEKVIGLDAGANAANPIAGVFGSFARMWYEGEDGQVTYGSVTQQTRDTLEYLAGLYADGIIDPQFAVHDVAEIIIAGKCGIAFGDWSMSGGTLRQSFAFDGADWMPYAAPLDAEGYFNTTMPTPATVYVVVSKDCQNPEAVIQVIGAEYNFHRYIDLEPEWYDKMVEYNTLGVSWVTMPIHIQLEEDDIVAQRGKDLVTMIDTGNTEGIKAENVKFYEAYLTFLEDPTQLTGWARYKGMYLACNVANSDINVYTYPVFWGMTPMMEDMWATMQSMEDEIFMKIVMGEAPIEDFDKFVTEWHAIGGDTIIQEVQAYVDSR